MKTNEELLKEANSIEFKFTAGGHISRKHTEYELSLYTIKRAIEAHGMGKYLFGKIHYVNSKTKVVVVCKKHEDFKILPANLTAGKGCPKCTSNHHPKNPRELYYGDTFSDRGYEEYMRETRIQKRNALKEKFLIRAVEVHGEKYNYHKVLYKNALEAVEIICPHHGSFFQAPTNHLGGSGCPKCAGRNHDIIYMLRCKDTGWYKIGITTDNIKRRMAEIGGNLEEVYHVLCEDPRHHENILHKKYEKDREYNLCVKSGPTEFFSLTEQQVQEVINYMKELK